MMKVVRRAAAAAAGGAAAVRDDRIEDAAGGKQARDWFSEHGNVREWPLHPTEGPNHDAWLLYDERMFEGKMYRFFLPADVDFGGFSGFGYPSDGSPVLPWKTKKPFKSLRDTGKAGKYPAVCYWSDELTKSDKKKQKWQLSHQAVALLWGAIKRTAHPMSLQLVTDHIENIKTDFRVKKLQFITATQNSVKDRGTTFPDGLEPIKPEHFVGGAAAAGGAVVATGPY
jgi:hypothetical protein